MNHVPTTPYTDDRNCPPAHVVWVVPVGPSGVYCAITAPPRFQSLCFLLGSPGGCAVEFEVCSSDCTGASKMGDGSSTYTTDDALRATGFGKFQALMLAYAGMAYVSEAMEVMLLSFVGPAVKLEWNLSSNEESLITSLVFVGMLLGAYTWGIVSDNYGRRKGFLFTALITGGAGLLSSFAPNYLSLIFLRFLVGIGLGGAPVLFSWFLEFVPAPSRGTWMVIYSFFWTLGTILEASLAWAIMPTCGWRWLLALSSFPTFVLLLFYRITPESPRYLCMKGKRTDAIHVLEKIATLNHMELPSGMLISDYRSECGTVNPSEQIHLITAPILETAGDEYTESNAGGITALSRLLSPKLIRTTLLLWISFVGNSFAYYGVVLLTSELSGKSKCTSPGLYLGLSEDANRYKDIFITSFAEVPGLLLSAVIVDRVGRKISMSTMLFASCIFLLPLMFHQTELLTTSLLFGARICITGSFTVLFIYAPEVYPTSIRTTGAGAASSVGRIGGMICPLVAVSLVQGCHQTGAILLFEIVIFLSGLAVLFFPFETSSRELSDSVLSLV